MKNWTIKQRIIFGFAAVLLLLTAVATTSTVLLEKIKIYQQSLTEDALPGMETSESIVATTGELQLNVLRHLLAQTPGEKQQFDETIKSLIATNHQELNDYEGTIFRQNDREQFAKVKETQDDYLKALQPVLELSRAGKTDEALTQNKQFLRPAFLGFRRECLALFGENKTCGDYSATESKKSLALAKWLVLSLSVAGIALGMTLATIIVIGLSRVLNRATSNLNSSSHQVATAAGQVSSTSQTLAQGASEQAASIEETSSSLEELSAMTKRNADNVQKANDLAKQARAAADKGSVDMLAMNQAMDALRISSEDISKIIKTIDEIAFQTNILALNAAVEAARAGEAGMGFSVVADEVRNLAQRSANAARETATKIEGAIVKTAQGVEISGKVTQTLNEITTKVKEVNELVTEIASASQQQTLGITQINVAVGQMDKVIQNNASSAEESAAAAEELNAQAVTMKQSVVDLLKLVDGQRRVAASNTFDPAGLPTSFGPLEPGKQTTLPRKNRNQVELGPTLTR